MSRSARTRALTLALLAPALIAAPLAAPAAELPQPPTGTVPALPAGALADFRAFAASQGVDVPPGKDADRVLNRLLLGWLAGLRWGDAASAEIAAREDGDVQAARALFDRAAGILAGRP